MNENNCFSKGSKNMVIRLDHEKIIRIQTYDNNVDNELKICQHMYELGVAPKIHHIYKHSGVIAIIMSKYDCSFGSYIINQEDPIWEINLCILLKKVAFSNYVCLDMKPENIIIKHDIQHRIIDMKLIDFGSGLCIVTEFESESNYLIMLFIFKCICEEWYKPFYRKNVNMFEKKIIRLLLKNNIKDEILLIFRSGLINIVWSTYMKNKGCSPLEYFTMCYIK